MGAIALILNRDQSLPTSRLFQALFRHTRAELVGFYLAPVSAKEIDSTPRSTKPLELQIQTR